MRLAILGSAAGGGFPQWNCGCRLCSAARQGFLLPRGQPGFAVSAGGDWWYLINPSAEIRTQLTSWGKLSPRGTRDTPIRGVLLTDGEFDHTLGLFELRQGASWVLYAPEGVLEVLGGLGLPRLLAPYACLEVQGVVLGSRVELEGLQAAWFPLSHRVPRYASQRLEGASCALLLEAGGRRVLYAPAVPSLQGIEALLEGVAVVLFDGTFFRASEPIDVGLLEDAWEMGHVPVEVSAPWLAGWPGRKIYLHLNNTNPLLDPSSSERAWVEDLGLEIAEDGMEILL